MYSAKLTLLIIAIFPVFTGFGQYKATTAAEKAGDAEKRKLLEQTSYLKDVGFRNIGPSIMGGRVSDLDVNPADPTEFYVAYSSGGLWYTVNNGLSFIPVFDKNENLFMGDIAVDWKSGTIWVGTGEVNSSRSSYAGSGVYRSKDKGKSWDYLGLRETHHIGKILLHPSNKNTVWVAAMGHLYSPNKQRGVYKTEDGGKTWKLTLALDDKTGAVDMDIDPLQPNTIYACTWYRTRTAWNFEEGGKSSGIYKSVDGGSSWTLLTKTGTGFPAQDILGRTGVAVYPKDPQIVYAILDNQSPRGGTQKDTSSQVTSKRLQLKQFKDLTKQEFAQLDNQLLDSFLSRNDFPAGVSASTIKEMVAGGSYKPSVIYDYLKGPNEDLALADAIKGCEVYRSDNGGKSWRKTNTTALDKLYSTYGYYFGKIYVSPSNPDKVFITGTQLLESVDGGKTFRSIDSKLVHPDHHALWIDPLKEGHLINGNDGGVNITYDDGKNWFKVTSVPAGQFYSVYVDNDKPYNVYGGLQDNGVWYGPSTSVLSDDWLTTGSNPFKSIAGNDGMMVQVDTRDNSTYYTGSQFGAYFRNNKLNKAEKSIRPKHQLGEPPLRFNWETPILLSRHNPDILYLGSNRFHRSLNRGDTMETISADLTKGGKPGDVPYGTISWIAESPIHFGLLYTGTDDGLVYISRDNGYTWAKISHTLPQDLWVNCITASAFKEGRVYLALSGYRLDHFNPYLFVSEDYGASWKPIHGNLPFETINAIKEDPKHENILYVATDGGLYATIDRGKTFMPFTKDLPKVAVHDITIQERENEIVIATHGRSIFIAKLDQVQRLLTDKAFYEKKKTDAERLTSFLAGGNKKELRQKEGVEVDCPVIIR